MLPNEVIELLHEYTSAHLRGDLEGVQKALAALDEPPKEKAKLKPIEQLQTKITNPLSLGERVTDNN